MAVSILRAIQITVSLCGAGDGHLVKNARSEDLDTLTSEASEKLGVQLVLDPCNVQYMSSTALGKLINLKKKVMGVRGRLKIENLHSDLLEVFRITCLDQVFDIGR
jgi:anti-anti-sigma factor